MRTFRRVAATFLLAFTLPISGSQASSSPPAVTADASGSITVMGRNLYLGADVAIALDLLPDMPAAAQFMWDQVASTDFGARVDLLAKEAADHHPDVIGLQEATVWECRANAWSRAVPVFDFTTQFLAATAAAGVEYRIAEHNGVQANNPGYSIPSIPGLTTVRDPHTFQPLFGKDSADCGFVIGDALLVRADLADQVLAAGTSDFENRYAVVPVVFTIDRGYAWADLNIAGTTVRAVTAHLESLWDTGVVPPSAAQAKQLVADLAPTTVPLIVIGDFNSDPRDPRPEGAPNGGGQPLSSDACQAQPESPTATTAHADCSAYWTMIASGYADAGPDSLAAVNWTWGSEGDLAGPDPERLKVALDGGNEYGFTDRLDYVFTRNAAKAESAEVIGDQWPVGETWECNDPAQVKTTEASSALLASRGVIEAPLTGKGVCLPTDHAGIVTEIRVSGPPGAQAVPAPDGHSSFLRLNLLGWIGVIVGVLLFLLVLLIWGSYRLLTRGRRRRASASD